MGDPSTQHLQLALIFLWNDEYAPNREWSRLLCPEWSIFTGAFIHNFSLILKIILTLLGTTNIEQLINASNIHFTFHSFHDGDDVMEGVG